MSTRIWHNYYEKDWMRAFPLGNGRIGAMLYGNPDRETIEINEESLWSGKQIKEVYHSSPEALKELRDLLFAEKYEKAADLCEKTFLSNPRRVRYYESFGELFIDYADKRDYCNYCKELELKEAIARVSYQKGNTSYCSQSFVSEKYDVFVYRMDAEGEPFSCNITMERAQDAYTSALHDDTLLLNGRVTFKTDELRGEGVEGMQFGARIYVVSDGQVSSDKHSIHVENATSFTIYSAFATNYNVDSFDIDESIDYRAKLANAIDTVKTVDFETIKQEHIADHKKWFDTLTFELDAPAYDDIPTDERLRRVINQDFEDNDLYVLYYNFGRYLLIESSGKKATLPANLQGIWCSGFRPPWGSDYHTNINLQMNYWPAETANMSDTFKPFVHLVKMLSKFGTATAKELFGADGWVVNHTTDVFGRTGVHDSVQCGFFPMAGPWLCLNLWEHYEFTNDREYLKEIYPIMKGSCQFVKDYLVEGSDGYLITNPSNSPENCFYYIDENGEKKTSMFTYGATMDFEIIYALFTRTISACRILSGADDADVQTAAGAPGVSNSACPSTSAGSNLACPDISADNNARCEDAFAQELQEVLAKLPPLRISERYGTICEWIKDYEEQEPGHRHISHMFGLFPSDQINETDPAIYQAAKNTIARRLSNGGGATGWSRAWIINFYARLKDRENALENLSQLMKRSTAENLFDMHPPFQIDGNFGAVSGMTEMLIQSHLGTPEHRIIELLPALPGAWKSGSVKGVRARGNFAFDITWENHKPTRLVITSFSRNTLRLKMQDSWGAFSTGKAYVTEDSVLKMELAENETVEIVF